MTIADRINLLVEELSFDNGIAFAQKTGINESSLSKWRHGTREPTRKSLEKILAVYPQVRRDWLMHGQGNPFVAQGNKEVKQASIESIQERIDKLDKMMAELMGMMRELAKK